MKQDITKNVDVNLASITLKIEDLPTQNDELEVLGRNLYAEAFLSGETPGMHLLHDGEQIFFDRRRFTHAFSYAEHWQVSKVKTGLDKRRIMRVNWILPMIQGQVSGSECWQILEFAERKRIYLSFKQGYVVWLESTNKGRWEFSTAYTASSAQIRKYTQIRGNIKEVKRIWSFTQ